MREDLDELLFLTRTAQARLARIDRELRRLRPRLRGETVAQILRRIEREHAEHEELAARVLDLCRAADRVPARESRRIADLETAREDLSDVLRSTEAVIAALAVAADWQSPSFGHSIRPLAGRDLGRVISNHSDYRRDRHPDAEAYERAHVAAMIDRGRGVRALLTGCGMAAFTTILDWLRAEGSLRGTVLAGRDLYHETRDLLLAATGDRVVVVDECDTAATAAAIRATRPSAVFLDSLGNTARTALPDLEAVARELAAVDAGSCLVIDNTALGPTFQPFSITTRGAPRVVAFESLLKYAQLGHDRANAGLITARVGDAARLERWRERLGTNVGDFAVQVIPPPSAELRRLLERRLVRMERNALTIASRIRSALSGQGLEGFSISHPALPGHRSAAVAARRPFRGSCVALSFDGVDAVDARLLQRATAEARRRGAQLVAGSSFGFDSTRIYLAVDRSGVEPGFIRIAAGTGHHEEVQAVGESIAAAVVAAAHARPARRVAA